LRALLLLAPDQVFQALGPRGKIHPRTVNATNRTISRHVLVSTSIAPNSIVATVASCGEIIGSSNPRSRAASLFSKDARISWPCLIPKLLTESLHSTQQVLVFPHRCRGITCQLARPLHQAIQCNVHTNRVTLPAMVKRRRKESVQVIGQTLFEVLAAHRAVFRHCAQQDSCFQFLRSLQHTRQIHKPAPCFLLR